MEEGRFNTGNESSSLSLPKKRVCKIYREGGKVERDWGILSTLPVEVAERERDERQGARDSWLWGTSRMNAAGETSTPR